ncbi:IS200/IS605 family transposase [Paenibacillus alginolyticus]|uniref:IS200/IS605 family transposase n=1 Tax=Paenibacillus alginolyticus TaxID=59839 RepID=A0ABT4G9L7_9BACL|nr:IS200/IS605 family transposase [Paenibacillus alginolyticus]MCY9692871.1 IS200/IS605 family transposase [Paenibacillus alginolyticus]MEC0142929.1 IS200/IS605 family transposase [Paenibacillus alginolyticus]
MGQEYRRTATTVSLINYHFVFCPRYRRKIFVKQVDARFKELMLQLCMENNWLIIEMEVMPDHVHLFLNVLPTDSPADIMAKLKGATSRYLRQEFEHLNHLPSLWTRSYLVSTAGNVSSETVKRYVEEQKTRG